MAGIGFAIKRMFRKDTITADMGAYLSGGLILTGAWVFTAVSIAIVTLASAAELPWRSQALLLAIITCSFCGAQILTSALSLPLTRFVADRLYSRDSGSFGPAYAAASLVHCIAAVALGMNLYCVEPLRPLTRGLGVLLLVACTQIWVATGVSGLMRRPGLVAASYLLSCVVSAVAALLLGRIYQLDGYLGGVTLGMCILALLLTAQLVVRLPFPRAVSFAFFKTALQRYDLAFVGIFLAVGTWIDKIIFWTWESTSLRLTATLHAFPAYDICFFLGYITVVPAFALSLIHLETRVSVQVRKLFSRLLGRESPARVAAAKSQLITAVVKGHELLIRTQLPITLVALFCAPGIVHVLGLSPNQIHLFQFSAIAAIGIVLMQTQLVYLLYFDLSGQAAVTAGVYAVSNLTLNLLSLQFGYWSYGLGHLVAAYTAAAVGMYLVGRALPRLEFITLSYYAQMALRSDELP
jgi:uncharacterized membrane protein